MTEHLLYIAGAPGTGKSSVMRALRAPWDLTVHHHAEVPHTVLRSPHTGAPTGVELGVPRESFPGTDALSMSIGPRAQQFVLRSGARFVLGEGARLATRPFLGGCATQGVRTTLVCLSADPELLDERWRARGAKQNPSWRKGAATRAREVGRWFGTHLGQDGFEALVTIDCTELTVDEVTDRVLQVFPAGDLRRAVPAPRVGD